MQIAQIGNQRQFWFNAQYLISQQQRITLLQQQPTKHPANPVLLADRPWESTGTGFNNAIHYDPQAGQWQVWYESYPAGTMIYTALSQDGIHWEKPALGLFPVNGSTANNIVLQPGYWDGYALSVVKSPTETDPARRYKLYFWMGPEWFNAQNPVHVAIGNRVQDYQRNGHYVAFSPDGIHWTPQTDAPALIGLSRKGKSYTDQTPAGLTEDVVLGIGDVCSVTFDEQKNRYRASHKLNKMKPGWEMSRRCSGVSESSDGVYFEHWVSTLDPDAEDDAWARAQGGLRTEFYGINVWPQHGFYLGLLWVFLVTQTGKPPYGRGWDDGPVLSHLVYSADGLHWQRLPVRESFIPPGPAGSFDGACVYAGSRPVIVGDEVRFYYGGVPETHGSTNPDLATGIGLATLARDRYVGWKGNAAPGTLQTTPIQFSGHELHLNLDAAHGNTRVALLDAAGTPLPGYSLDDCDPLSTDSLDQVVSWRGGSDLSALAGQPICVHFSLRHSTLYTWQFV